MNILSRILLVASIAVVWTAGSPAMAEDLKDPVEILKKVDAAAKAVNFVKYDVTVAGTDALKARVPQISAQVLSRGDGANGMPKHARIVVSSAEGGAGQTLDFVAGTDGDVFYVIDNKSKKSYVDMDSEVLGSFGQPVQFVTVAEFHHPAPFSDEINGDKKELVGSQKIGDEDCYEIHVHYAGGRGEAIWCFSKKDFLPRRRVDVRESPTGEKGTIVKTVTALTLDPKVGDDAFKFKNPDGFEKVDDFAP